MQSTERWRESWRTVWAPQLERRHLEALARGLRENDPGLEQGLVVFPPRGSPAALAESACAISYCGWKGENIALRDEVYRFFTGKHIQAFKRGLAIADAFINWYDATPRDDMRRELLAEVERSLGNEQDGCSPGGVGGTRVGSEAEHDC